MCQAFPVVFALMETKTREAYVEALKYIKNQVPQLQPTVVVTDFEKALHLAVREVFPTAHLLGCWFHSANAMRRRARNIGLTQSIVDDETVRKVYFMTLALPLLPADRIVEGFEAIKQFADPVVNEVAQYLDYVNSTWIQGIGPAHLSVFGQRRRTNNDQESYHRCLLQKMGVAHPNVWTFIDGIRKIEQSNRQKYSSIIAGAAGTRARPTVYLANDRRIQEASALLVQGSYTCTEFLHRVSYSISTLAATILLNGSEEDEEITPPDVRLPLSETEEPAAEVGHGRAERRVARRRTRRHLTVRQRFDGIEEYVEVGRARRGRGNYNRRGRVDGRGTNRGHGRRRTARIVGPQPIQAEQEAATAPIVTRQPGICVVCIGSLATHVVVPCGHICVCSQCTQSLENFGQNDRCPTCRAPALGIYKVYANL